MIVVEQLAALRMERGRVLVKEMRKAESVLVEAPESHQHRGPLKCQGWGSLLTALAI